MTKDEKIQQAFEVHQAQIDAITGQYNEAMDFERESFKETLARIRQEKE